MALLPVRPACRYRDRRIRAAVFLCYDRDGIAVTGRGWPFPGTVVALSRDGCGPFPGRLWPFSGTVAGPGRDYSPCGSSECRARKSWKACR